MENSETRTGPLSGVRVIDMTRHMAGPYGAAMLADYGADVIKVEPLYGDQARSIGRDYVDGESGLFLTWNRNKRSIAIDYRSKEGREVLERLVLDADIFCHNFRPEAAEKGRLNFEALSAINPRLVHARVIGFGSEGPWTDRPATDPVIQAMSGVMGVTGPQGGEPCLVGVPVADFTGAMLQVIGVLMALRERDRTGVAQEVEISMLAGLMSALTTRVSSVFYGGYEPIAMGSSHSAVMPYQAFETADGFVIAGTWGEEGWGRFCEAVEMPELEHDERFASNGARLENRDALVSILGPVFATRSRAEWDYRFKAADALFGYVYTVSEALTQPQAEANEMVITVDHPRIGPIKMLAPPIKLSEQPGPMLAPPLLGQHSREVLEQHGFDDARITRLLEAGVVFQAEAVQVTP